MRCFGVGGWLCVLLTTCMVRSRNNLGWYGEVMYEVSYICVQFPVENVFEVGS